MRASRPANLSKPSRRNNLNALAAFAAGMFIALTVALIYLAVQSSSTVRAASVASPERSGIDYSEVAATTAAHHAPSSVKPSSLEQPKLATVSAQPSTVARYTAPASETNDTAVLSVSKPVRPAGDSELVQSRSSGPALEPAHISAMPSSPHVLGYAASVLPSPPPNTMVQTKPTLTGTVTPPTALGESHGNEAEAALHAVQPLPAASPDVPRPEPKPKFLTVQPGTVIPIRLAETLSSDRNRTGDTFRATLAAPVVVNGAILAESGSTVLGRVVNARKAPLIGGTSELSLNITDITAGDGRLVPVATDVYRQQGSHSTIANTAKMTTGAAVGAVLGALTGAAEGAGITSALRQQDRTGGFMATQRIVLLPAGTQASFALATAVTLPE